MRASSSRWRRSKGWVSQRWRVRAPRSPRCLRTHPSAPLYTPSQRARAREGRLDGLRMPRVLSLFAHKMGARFISEPLYDARFRRFSMPLVAALDELPASTLARFNALDAGASARGLSRAPSPSHFTSTPSGTGTAPDRRRTCRRRPERSPDGLDGRPGARGTHAGGGRWTRTPAARRLFEGSIDAEGYAHYLVQTYHYVRWTTPLLAEAGQRMKRLGAPPLAELLLQKATEERGTSGGCWRT